jgi:hypothetical protein
MPASDSLSSSSFTVPLPLPELTAPASPPYATGTSDDEHFVTDTNKAFFNAVIATNSISLAACLFVITAYFFLHRKYPQVMSRTSLKLSVAMACSDTIYHVRRISLKVHARLLTTTISPRIWLATATFQVVSCARSSEAGCSPPHAFSQHSMLVLLH